MRFLNMHSSFGTFFFSLLRSFNIEKRPEKESYTFNDVSLTMNKQLKLHRTLSNNIFFE